jgi:NAD-reducing hydrogenase small subunit
VDRRLTLATVWLDGCSGCHMSLLDIDDRLIEITARMDLVYSPLVDHKRFPDDVDVTLVEGAVSTDEDLQKIRRVRERTRTLVALGDCAVTSNVPGMRNQFGVAAVLECAYPGADGERPGAAGGAVPRLLPRVRPVHEVVPVDVFLPGCPPPADAIYSMLCDLIEGRTPEVTALSRFGK